MSHLHYVGTEPSTKPNSHRVYPLYLPILVPAFWNRPRYESQGIEINALNNFKKEWTTETDG